MGFCKRAKKSLEDAVANVGKLLINTSEFLKPRILPRKEELSPAAKAAAVEVFVPSARDKRSSTISSRNTSITFLAATPQDCDSLQADKGTETQGLASLPQATSAGVHGGSTSACDNPTGEDPLSKTHSQKSVVATKPLDQAEAEGLSNKFPNSATPPTEAETRCTGPNKKCSATEGTVQYTAGESRIVVANDGTKDCVALLLTEDMVSEVMQNLDKRHRLKMMDEEYQDVYSQVKLGEISLEAARERIAKTNNQDEIDGLLSQMKEYVSKLIDLRKKRATLESQLERAKSDLKCGYDRSLVKIEESIQKARLLNSQEPVHIHKAASLSSQDSIIADPDADDGIKEQSEASILAAKRRKYKNDLRTYYKKPQYVAPPPSELYLSSDLSAKQNQHLEAHRCYQKAVDRCRFAEESLNDWSFIYSKREAHYRLMVATGQCKVPEDWFYTLVFEPWIDMCKNMRLAQEERDAAVARVRNLSSGVGLDQKSQFPDDSEDGYSSDGEFVEVEAMEDTTALDKWVEEVREASAETGSQASGKMPPLDLPLKIAVGEWPKIDECSIKSLEIRDSLSVRDTDEYFKQIESNEAEVEKIRSRMAYVH